MHRRKILMGPLSSDLRFFVREFRRRPYFTLTTIFSLAIGIGATSAVFSVIYAVLLNPYPYPGANRIVELRLQDKASNDHYVILSGQQLNQLRQARSIESIVGLTWWNLTTTDGDLPEDVQGLAVSADSPNHFGTPALKGRWLLPSDAPPGRIPCTSWCSTTNSGNDISWAIPMLWAKSSNLSMKPTRWSE